MVKTAWNLFVETHIGNTPGATFAEKVKRLSADYRRVNGKAKASHQQLHVNITFLAAKDKKDFTAAFNHSDNVSTLRTLIAKRTRIPEDSFRIVSKGRIMNDMRQLSSYDLTDPADVRVIMKVKLAPYVLDENEASEFEKEVRKDLRKKLGHKQ